MDAVLSVDSVYGRPAGAAARATASSPSGWTMRVNPVGASTKGYETGEPRSADDVWAASTFRRTLGRKPVRAKAARFAGHSELVVGAAVHVAEHTSREAPPGQRSKVVDRGGAGQPPLDPVGLDAFDADDRTEVLDQAHRARSTHSRACHASGSSTPRSGVRGQDRVASFVWDAHHTNSP